MSAYISIGKACKILDCNEHQLYQLINDQPRLIRNRGTGMQRKLCSYDIHEWKKRPTTINHQLSSIEEMPVIRYTPQTIHPAPTLRKAPQIRKIPAMKKAPETIHQGKSIFHKLTTVSEKLGRAQSTLMNWLEKSSFKVVALKDPNEKDSPARNYILEPAIAYLEKMAGSSIKAKTKKSVARAAGHDSMETVSIPHAANILKVKDAKIRHLVKSGQLKGHGPFKRLVKIYEARKALDKKAKKSGPKGPTGPRLERQTSAPAPVSITNGHAKAPRGAFNLDQEKLRLVDRILNLDNEELMNRFLNVLGV